MTNSNLLNAKSVQSIMAKRRIIDLNDVDSTLKFNVSGTGSLVAALKADKTPAIGYDGQPMMKTIYNLNLNSRVAITSKLCKDMLIEAWQAEQAGEEQKAHDLYRTYLNKTQVSFTILAGRKNVQFYDKQLVEGEVKLITTENGSLLTLENVAAVAVPKAKATPAFTFADLLGEIASAKPEDVFSTGSTGVADDPTAAILAAAGTQADA